MLVKICQHFIEQLHVTDKHQNGLEVVASTFVSETQFSIKSLHSMDKTTDIAGIQGF